MEMSVCKREDITGGGGWGVGCVPWPVKEVCRDQEHYDKCGRGGRGDK